MAVRVSTAPNGVMGSSSGIRRARSRPGPYRRGRRCGSRSGIPSSSMSWGWQYASPADGWASRCEIITSIIAGWSKSSASRKGHLCVASRLVAGLSRRGDASVRLLDEAKVGIAALKRLEHQQGTIGAPVINDNVLGGNRLRRDALHRLGNKPLRVVTRRDDRDTGLSVHACVSPIPQLTGFETARSRRSVTDRAPRTPRQRRGGSLALSSRTLSASPGRGKSFGVSWYRGSSKRLTSEKCVATRMWHPAEPSSTLRRDAVVIATQGGFGGARLSRA